jgi:drug/metabolite transporter (DMT)-like permease
VDPRGPTAIGRGIVPALLAAVCFGATTPIIALWGRNVGPLSTAALLYGGAAMGALGQRAVIRSNGVRLTRASIRRVVLVALVGAAIAPTLLAWGLRRTGGTTGSLLLNLEAVFTVLLARAVHGEPIGRRVTVAMTLMVAAGLLLTFDLGQAGGRVGLGAVAVGLATLAWAVDNTLTRPLSEADPVSVVGLKAFLGAAMTAALALLLGERAPPLGPAAVLLACGATGYGLSLRLYLMAQRRIGVARTGSVFALAPFVGAALGWALGFRAAGPLTALSAILFGVAVHLHVTERHRHRHRHEAIDHTHAHRHDDGHHAHVHDTPAAGEHSHLHHHEALEHDHDHAPDLHHVHAHVPRQDDDGR